jgi:hypothetical protein
MAYRELGRKAIAERLWTWREEADEDLSRFESASRDDELRTGESHAYITSNERCAEVRGAREIALRQLNRKFGTLPEAIATQVTQLSVEQVQTLGEDLLDWLSIAELEQWLTTQTE